MTVYLDDSGTQDPDHISSRRKEGPDWFALGGVIVAEHDQNAVVAAHQSFCSRWQLTKDAPLHSNDIRQFKNAFKRFGTLPADEQKRFFEELNELVTSPSLTAIACVVDRPGYNARYRDRYGRRRWQLGKTAFNVVVERAVKFARSRGARLRVYMENSDSKTERRFKQYYEALRTQGLPFDKETSAKYAPLTPAEFKETLFEFRIKQKSSALMQLADLALYPMCIGGYNPTYRSYVAMDLAGVLINNKLAPDEVRACGIKYSCWELEALKTPKPGQNDQALGQPSTTTSRAMPTANTSETV